jgi:hypothetical protein
MEDKTNDSKQLFIYHNFCTLIDINYITLTLTNISSELQTWIHQHFPRLFGWEYVENYSKDLTHAWPIFPLRGN